MTPRIPDYIPFVCPVCRMRHPIMLADYRADGTPECSDCLRMMDVDTSIFPADLLITLMKPL